jgi:hypothetical protein
MCIVFSSRSHKYFWMVLTTLPILMMRLCLPLYRAEPRSNLYKELITNSHGDRMKQIVALLCCLLVLGCTIGVNLDTPENTVGTWVRSYNDRDVEGIYITLSKGYIMANGGEERVKANIGAMLEEAKKSETTYIVKGIGLLALSKEQPGSSSSNGPIYLARMDKKYSENGEKLAEEIILNFRVVKEDGEYKIDDFWD